MSDPDSDVSLLQLLGVPSDDALMELLSSDLRPQRRLGREGDDRDLHLICPRREERETGHHDLQSLVPRRTGVPETGHRDLQSLVPRRTGVPETGHRDLQSLVPRRTGALDAGRRDLQSPAPRRTGFPDAGHRDLQSLIPRTRVPEVGHYDLQSLVPRRSGAPEAGHHDLQSLFPRGSETRETDNHDLLSQSFPRKQREVAGLDDAQLVFPESQEGEAGQHDLCPLLVFPSSHVVEAGHHDSQLGFPGYPDTPRGVLEEGQDDEDRKAGSLDPAHLFSTFFAESNNVFRYPEVLAVPITGSHGNLIETEASPAFLDTPPATPLQDTAISPDNTPSPSASLNRLPITVPRQEHPGSVSVPLGEDSLLHNVDFQEDACVISDTDNTAILSSSQSRPPVTELGGVSILSMQDQLHVGGLMEDFSVFSDADNSSTPSSSQSRPPLPLLRGVSIPPRQDLFHAVGLQNSSAFSDTENTTAGLFRSRNTPQSRRGRLGGVSMPPGEDLIPLAVDNQEDVNVFSDTDTSHPSVSSSSGALGLQPEEEEEMAEQDLDPRLLAAWRKSRGSCSLQPLLKEELRLKIMKRRLDSGQDDLHDQRYDSEPPMYQMTEEERARRVRRREQNREAAHRFRQRKKQRDEQMLTTVQENERKRQRLTREVALLRNHAHRLQETLSQHRRCGDCRLLCSADGPHKPAPAGSESDRRHGQGEGQSEADDNLQDIFLRPR